MLSVTTLAGCAENPSKNDQMQMSVAVRKYVDEAISLMREESLFKHEADWQNVSSEVYRLAEGARSPQDSYQAIAAGLKLLDHHSFFSDRDNRWVPPPDYNETTEPTFPLDPVGLLLDQQVAYLLIPQTPWDPEMEAEYAARIQSLMKEVDGDNTCGWIIDLRSNRGGNMWPMLEAVGSLLEPDDDGRLGAWVSPDIESPEWWGFRDGEGFSTDWDVPNYVAEDYIVSKPAAPVAILIGGWTASSGEFLAVAFIGRPKTALFGEDSSGYLTANEPFELSDGATMALATAITTDRSGVRTRQKLVPDFHVDQQSQETSIEDDKTIVAARDWIKKHSECVQF